MQREMRTTGRTQLRGTPNQLLRRGLQRLPGVRTLPGHSKGMQGQRMQASTKGALRFSSTRRRLR